MVRAKTGPQEGARADRLPASHDDAVALLKEITEHRLDPRDLTKSQRQACVLVMANGKLTSAQLAKLLQCSPSLIRKDLQEIRRTLGREVREWGVEDVLGQLALAREKCSAMAMEQEDAGLAWSIELQFAKALKELGVVRTEEQHDGVKITIEALGAGYERAREALGKVMSPRLTGRVVDDEPDEPLLAPPPLALEQRFPDQPDQPPPPVIVDVEHEVKPERGEPDQPKRVVPRS